MGMCKHCGKTTYLTHLHSCEIKPKEPQYLYVYYHPQNSSIRLLDYEDKNSYYIGKIKLEDTE